MSTSGQKGLQRPPPKYHLRSGPVPLNTKHPRKVSLSSQASEVLLGKGEGGGAFSCVGLAGNFFFFFALPPGLRDLSFLKQGCNMCPLLSLGVCPV